MFRVAKIARSPTTKNLEMSWKIHTNGAHNVLTFTEAPKKILVSKKYYDSRAREVMTNVCQFLREKGAEVVVDSRDPDVEKFSDYPAVSCHIVSSDVDFVVCLGGDGTVLRTVGWIGECSSSEDDSVETRIPPVLAFGVGTLGFLAPFSVSEYKPILSNILSGKVSYPVTLRSRLECEIYGPDGTTPVVTRRVLNECLVARGSHSAFQHLDCEIDGMRIAQFQADGLIVATPSGSSAYSMAAGGSLVSPSVPCILLTPVAPHGLSARPLILPDFSTIEVRVPKYARARPIVSFDGHHEMTLERGSRVRITKSKSYVPFLRLVGDNHQNSGINSDWFTSLRSKLNWAKEVRKPIATSSSL